MYTTKKRQEQETFVCGAKNSHGFKPHRCKTQPPFHLKRSPTDSTGWGTEGVWWYTHHRGGDGWSLASREQPKYPHHKALVRLHSSVIPTLIWNLNWNVCCFPFPKSKFLLTWCVKLSCSSAAPLPFHLLRTYFNLTLSPPTRGLPLGTIVPIPTLQRRNLSPPSYSWCPPVHPCVPPRTHLRS